MPRSMSPVIREVMIDEVFGKAMTQVIHQLETVQDPQVLTRPLGRMP